MTKISHAVLLVVLTGCGGGTNSTNNPLETNDPNNELNPGNQPAVQQPVSQQPGFQQPTSQQPDTQQPVLQDAPSAVGVCVDTDPVGDGWGWNESGSCQLATTTTQQPEQMTDRLAGNSYSCGTTGSQYTETRTLDGFGSWAGTLYQSLYEPVTVSGNYTISGNKITFGNVTFTINSDGKLTHSEEYSHYCTLGTSTQPQTTYLKTSTNYYCSANNTENGWIWNFSPDNTLKDSLTESVGTWSWTGNNTISVAPTGNSSVDVIDQTSQLGLFDSNSNTQWGSCTIATSEHIRVVNLPSYTLSNGKTVKGERWIHQDLTGKTVACNYWYLVDGIWEQGNGYSLSGIEQTWLFNADGTGHFSTYRMSTDGIFNWTKNSHNEYLVTIIDNNHTSVQRLTDKNNYVWFNNDVWHILPNDTTEDVSSSWGCSIR